MKPLNRLIIAGLLAIGLGFLSTAVLAANPKNLDEYTDMSEFVSDFYQADEAGRQAYAQQYWTFIQEDINEGLALIPLEVGPGMWLVGLDYDGDRSTKFVAMVSEPNGLSKERATDMATRLVTETCDQSDMTNFLFILFNGLVTYEYVNEAGDVLLTVKIEGNQCVEAMSPTSVPDVSSDTGMIS
jgi:hypothetical protein